MSISTDAILVFGFEIGVENDGDPPDFLNGNSFEEFVVGLSGVTLSEDYAVACEQTKELMSECPAELVRHCSDEYSMYILAVRGTVSLANRGYPAEIDLEKLDIHPDQIYDLENWCEANNIPYEKPKWLLCSFCG